MEVTKEKIVFPNKAMPLTNMQTCFKEEADDRIFLHVNDMVKSGHERVTVITVDTDVVVIALYAFWDLQIKELYIEFGVGKSKQWIPIHEIAAELGEEVCRALLFWYSLSGCDTVSQFQGKGKKTGWQTWKRFPEVTEAFINCSSLNEPTCSDLKLIERFVVLLYDRSSSCSDVNECRRQLFVKQARAIDNCPPTQDALVQHIRRAVLQASIWAKCLDITQLDVDINNWGWSVDSSGNISPKITTLPKASKARRELKRCNCKKECSIASQIQIASSNAMAVVILKKIDIMRLE